MSENEQAAAEQAAVETTTASDPGDPSVEQIEELRAEALADEPEPGELIDVRESALEDLQKSYQDEFGSYYPRFLELSHEGLDIDTIRARILEEQNQVHQDFAEIPVERFVTVGDDVYYGTGNGHYYAAKVTNINEDRTVDLVVFERERIHHVFAIAKAELGQPGCINGWSFKA